MGDAFLRGQILLLPTTGNAGPSFYINGYPTQNESEKGMAQRGPGYLLLVQCYILSAWNTENAQ